MKQYQHLTQKAYLDSWNLSGQIYTIDPKTLEATPHQSAKSILGMDNIQTKEMEDAFEDVERCVGNIREDAEIQDPTKTILLAKWVALHAVRCKRHAHIIATTDYRPDVEHLTKHLLRLHAFFVISHNEDGSLKPSFITCDNPCLFLKRDGVEFWMMPLSPFKYISFSPFEAWADSPPWDINKNTAALATDHCVSFDASLHTVDPRPSQPLST